MIIIMEQERSPVIEHGGSARPGVLQPLRKQMENLETREKERHNVHNMRVKWEW